MNSTFKITFLGRRSGQVVCPFRTELPFKVAVRAVQRFKSNPEFKQYQPQIKRA